MAIEINIEVEILIAQGVIQADDKSWISRTNINAVGIIDFTIWFTREYWLSMLIGLEGSVLIVYVSVVILHLNLTWQSVWHPWHLFTWLH